MKQKLMWGTMAVFAVAYIAIAALKPEVHNPHEGAYERAQAEDAVTLTSTAEMQAEGR